MSKTKSSYQIPFLESGNMAKYDHDSNIVEWKDNFEFFDHINFLNFVRGRSAAHAIFEGVASQSWGGALNVSQGRRYVVFLTDLGKMLPHFVQGTVSGTFTFCKRGRNYGVKLVKVDG